LESVAEDALGGLTGDEFDTLNDTINYDVLNARVFSFGVFTDQDGIDVVVGSFVALKGTARADVGEKVEGSSECEVERDVTLANGSL